jgi:transposase
VDIIYPRCAGLDVHLDVHKESVVACVRIAADGQVGREVRTFETTTSGLLALSAWLAAQGCTHIAMEATGVYWKPVWHILSDGEFQLVLANAAHIKNVPGRKTDVNDATWIADLLAHGLIRASFVPEPEIQELRSLMRTRKQLVREQASHTQRLQKTLEEANIKLDAVISDILGASGRAMVEAMIAGETNPVKLADLADRRLRAPPEKLREALPGHRTPPLPVASSPAPDRCPDGRDRRDRSRGCHPHRALSCRGQPADEDARDQELGGGEHRGGDRGRYEPLSDGGTPPVLGRVLPAQR